MNSEDRIWLLISRAVSGASSPEELDELEQFFLLHPHFRIVYRDLKTLRIESPTSHSVDERRALDRGLIKFDNLLLKEGKYAEKLLFEQTTIRPLRHNRRKNWMIAASIISLLMIAALNFNYKRTIPAVAQQELSTLNGKRDHTTLPDGSRVWLNSGSSIKYSYNSNGNREVILEGEAYFDVKHDASHPFVVHAGKLKIAVLGTAFNVKAYTADKTAETTLIRGKVSISIDGSGDTPVVLLPNEKVTMSTNDYHTVKTQVTARKADIDSLATSPQKIVGLPEVPADVVETEWLNDKLAFKSESFSNLAKQLERWYDVTIVFDTKKYNDKQFTGAFKGQDINEVMRALQLIQPFNYKITNNKIHVW